MRTEGGRRGSGRKGRKEKRRKAREGAKRKKPRTTSHALRRHLCSSLLSRRIKYKCCPLGFARLE